MTARLVAILGLVLCGALDCLAQQAPPSPEPAVKSETSAVVVDVIVTDRKGHHVPGLSAGDFKLYEDGIPQAIGSFSPPPAEGEHEPTSSTHAVPTPAAPAGTAPTERAPAPQLITLLIDLGDLHPDSLKQACAAASRFAERTIAAGNLIAIYWVDTSLHLGVPFTGDRDRAFDILEKLSNRVPSGRFSVQEREQTQREVEQLAATSSAQLPQAPGGGSAPPDPAAAERDVLRSWITTANALQARTVFVALRAMALAYRDLPGRKNLVVLSEGFLHAVDGGPQIQAVIDAANRANVAIYVIDGGGLGLNASGTNSAMSVEKPVAPTTLYQLGVNQDALGTPSFGEGAPDRVTGGQDVFDRLQTLGSDSRADLGAIARATGGFLVQDTNDLGPALDRVEDDASEFYTLVYYPSNHNFNGAFRHIKVELAEPGGLPRYRQGYWAYPPGREVMMTPAAAQLLAAVQSGARKRSFVPQLKASAAPVEGGSLDIKATVAMPASLVRFNKVRDEYVAGVSVLLIARDEKDQIVAVHERYGEVRLDQHQRDIYSKTLNLQGHLLVPKPRSVSLQAIVQLADGKVGGSEVRHVDAEPSVERTPGLLMSERPSSSTFAQATGARALDQPDVHSYTDTRSVVDWSTRELLKNIPELKGLKPAESQDQLASILANVGANVAAFVREFPDTACTERISTTAYNSAGDEVMSRDDKYNYIALAASGAEGTDFREYRADSRGNPTQQRGPAVATGFVFASLHFDPKYQHESAFRLLGHQEMGGLDALVVAFAQRPGEARLWGRVTLSGRPVVVLVQGVAWIDPASYRILRLRTDLLAPQKDIGLTRDTTEIEYAAVHFDQGNLTLWLPREVKLRADLRDYDFHHRLLYSDFRLFTVETQQKLRPDRASDVVPPSLPRR
jgi:VWFA-related protein